MDYGQYVAMQRSRKKKASQDKAVGKPKSAPRKKSSPVLCEWPMHDNSSDVIEGIDWNDAGMLEHGSYLADELQAGRQFKLLTLPTGVGKTAIAVSALAKLKSENSNMQFVVVASRKIVDGRGWQKTINSYNACHDVKLDPYMIETFDRFSSICADAKCIAKMVKAVGVHLVIVLDEVHNYKNPTGKRAKKLQNLSFAKKLGLSATPFTNNAVLDSCSYLVMGGFYRNKTDFMETNDLVRRLGRNHELLVFDDDGRVMPELWPRYGEVQKELATIVYRPTVDMKSIDMPDVTTRVVQLDHSEQLDADLRSLYRAYVKRMFDSATEFRLAAMERICMDDCRVGKLMEVIDDPKTVQPLVFYYHTAVLHFLEKRMNDRGLEYQIISGAHPISEVDQTKDCPIFMQYQSTSQGIEFKKSNTSVFYENQYSFMQIFQARGRNVRRSMGHDVYHYSLIADNAFDREVYERVMRCEELSDALLDEIALTTLSMSSN